MLTCLLAGLHYVIQAHQVLSSVYKHLLPCFACKASRGIRPVAPKCIALVLNDSELVAEGLQRLGFTLDWSVGLLLQHESV